MCNKLFTRIMLISDNISFSRCTVVGSVPILNTTVKLKQEIFIMCLTAGKSSVAYRTLTTTKGFNGETKNKTLMKN